jgi:hypothetical protein
MGKNLKERHAELVEASLLRNWFNRCNEAVEMLRQAQHDVLGVGNVFSIPFS